MKKSWIALAALAILSLLLTYLNFSVILSNPNHSLISLGGDGMKNYFTFLYYVFFDKGLHFTGMNYPFGEHIIFTDNIPLLSSGIRYFSTWFPSLPQYSLGIMHGLVFISLNLGCYYVYKILRKYNVANFWAVPSAVFIIFFSPQLFKLFGHYGMGFVILIPFVIYQLMCYESSKKWKHIFYIFLLTMVCAFLHLYNLAIVGILVFFYSLAFLLLNRKGRFSQNIQYISPLLICVAIMFGLSLSFLKVTDHTDNRPDYPYGVLSSETIGRDIFVTNTPLGSIFQFAFGHAQPINATEGVTYIGIVSITVLAYLFFIFFTNLRKKQRDFSLVQPVKNYNIWLIVALSQLLFAMGFPFVWMRDWVSDHISVFRQFRSIGRFSWPFYYLIMIYVAIYIYQFIEKKTWSRTLKTLSYSAIVIIWCVQLSGYVTFIRSMVKDSRSNYAWYFDKNGDNAKKQLAQYQIDTNHYQAILGLPYFHIGSEKLWLMDVNEGGNMADFTRLSFLTGIPLANVMMSRTSWDQTFESVQIIDGIFNPKTILNRYNDKAILLAVDTSTTLKEKEKEWLENAQFLSTIEGRFKLYKVYAKDIMNHQKHVSDSIRSMATSLLEKEGLISDSSFFYANHFDRLKTSNSFSGAGSFTSNQKNILLPIDSFSVPANTWKKSYNFSTWMRLNLSDYRGANVILEFYDSAGQEMEKKEVITKYSTNVIKDWFLLDLDFEMPERTARIVINVKIDKSGKSFYGLDECVLRPSESIYFHKTETQILLNNRPQ